MKRALEVFLVAAALVLAGLVTIRFLSARASREEISSEIRPQAAEGGADNRPAPGAAAGVVEGLPMIQLTSPPRRRSPEVRVPPAAPSR